MTYFVLTYDLRRKPDHNYQPLYDLQKDWNAAHLQNSVWLADLNGKAAEVRDVMRDHLHKDDTVCVIELPDPIRGWATVNCRKTGPDWLRSH